MSAASAPEPAAVCDVSDENPAMRPVKALAEGVRAARQPVAPHNPMLQIEKAFPRVSCLARCLWPARDAFMESFFLNTYGSPLLQAMVGLGPQLRPGSGRFELRPRPRGTQNRVRADSKPGSKAGGIRRRCSGG